MDQANPDQFLRALQTVEAEAMEEAAEPLDRGTEDRLTRLVLGEIRAGQVARRRRRQRVYAAAGALAMAAAVLAIVWSGVPREPPKVLPGYGLALPGDVEVLGPAPQPERVARLTIDSILHVELRPAQRVAGPVVLRSFIAQAGQVRPVQLESERLPLGTFRIRQPVRDLPGVSAGSFSLVFIVGRGPDVPSAEQVGRALQARAATVGGWQLLRKEVQITSGG